MTESEKVVLRALHAEGYTVIRNGAPDFVAYKWRDTGNKKSPDDICFVEAKTATDKLRDDQRMWLFLLEHLGAKAPVARIHPCGAVVYRTYLEDNPFTKGRGLNAEGKIIGASHLSNPKEIVDGKEKE